MTPSHMTTEDQERAAYIAGDVDRAALLARIADLEDILIACMPYIEDATEDPAYKRERVQALLDRVCAALGEP